MLIRIKKSSFILFFTFLCCYQNAIADPAMWKIHSPTSTIYLFGSIHVGKPSMYPLSKAINHAYLSSHTLGVEVDIISPAMLKTMGWLWLNGTMKDNKKLKDVLSKEAYSLLQKILLNYKIPPNTVENLKPWIVALNLTNLNMSSETLSPQFGVDFRFLTRAHASHKNIIQFETASEQLGYFDNLSMKQQELFLTGTLKQMVTDQNMISDLLKFWQDGDIGNLEKLLMKDMKSASGEDDYFYDIFLKQRNIKFADKIAELLKTRNSYFIVVGAAHYIGPDSVIRYLQDKNIKVERVQ